MTSPRLIYVLDDEPGIVDVMRLILTEAGHEVQVAFDGRSLLRLIDRRLPDLVLMDINMPGLTGWEVRSRLMEDPETEAVPVIAVTALSGASVRESAIRGMGFADLIGKPFEVDDLLSRVEKALARNGATHAADGAAHAQGAAAPPHGNGASVPTSGSLAKRQG